MSATFSPALLGRTENTHRALLDRQLAGRDLGYEEWVALTLAARGGDGPLEARLTAALKADAAALPARLEARGLLAHGRPTAAGAALFAEVRAAIDAVLGPVYAQVPGADLVTAGRVLAQINARLESALA